MAITHYIENDEEIISAVGRLRKANEAENIFVFPKRALILQSIVNLKLLEREARKLGKQIVIVTQDAEGKILAEKAGFMTKQYNEEMMRGELATTTRFTVKHGEEVPMPVAETPVRPPRSTTLGSADFFSGAVSQTQNSIRPAAPAAISSNAPAVRTLRIRNNTPILQTSLNSKRTMEAIKRPVAQSAPQERSSDNSTEPLSHVIPLNPIEKCDDRLEKMHRFLSGSRPTPASPTQPIPAPQRNQLPDDEGVPSKVAPWIFAALGSLSLLAVLGAILFLVLPKAEITVIPQGGDETLSLQVKAATHTQNDDDLITARVLSRDITVSLSTEATGQVFAGTGKARGTVILTNNYSTSPQPLVATTRLLSTSGKLFRLVEGVSIPGITEKNGEKKPGVIEVSVIADEAGESFNIEPTEFRIPGFQGGPKYDAMSGKSTRSMTGGGSGGETSMSVSKTDIDRAAKLAQDQARTKFLEEIRGTVTDADHLLESSIEVSALGNPIVPAVGTSATVTTYESKYRVRAFVISETEVKNLVEKQLQDRMRTSEARLSPVSIELQYGTSLAKYDEETVEISIDAQAKMRAVIDTVKLRSELYGQNEDGIRAILERHPEVKRLQVDFKPKIFVATIPKKEDRVTIVVSDSLP